MTRRISRSRRALLPSWSPVCSMLLVPTRSLLPCVVWVVVLVLTTCTTRTSSWTATGFVVVSKTSASSRITTATSSRRTTIQPNDIFSTALLYPATATTAAAAAAAAAASVPPSPFGILLAASSSGRNSARRKISSLSLSSSSVAETAEAADEISTASGASSSPSTSSSSSSPYFTLQESTTGPADGTVHTLTFHRLPGQREQQEQQEQQQQQPPAEPPIVIETGKIGRQAAGSAVLTRGDSVVYATASRDDNPKPDLDFVPLSVEHQERFSAAGMTSGAYMKRDGRPAEHEILTCRLIDRPLRPLIDASWRRETQLLSWVLSYDGLRSCDPLAVTAAAAALWISDVPLHKPVAAVQVGILLPPPPPLPPPPSAADSNSTATATPESATIAEAEAEEAEAGKSNNTEAVKEVETATATATAASSSSTATATSDEEMSSSTPSPPVFVLNPTNEEMERSPLHLTVAGTEDSILMIEGSADFVPESVMVSAIQFGHDAVRVLCRGVKELGAAVAGAAAKKKKEEKKNANSDSDDPADADADAGSSTEAAVAAFPGLQDRVDAAMQDRVDDMFRRTNGDSPYSTKDEASDAMRALSKAAQEEIAPDYPEEEQAAAKKRIGACFQKLLKRRLFAAAAATGRRPDGRRLADVRRIDCRAGILPSVHGSALFTRGETQTVATATLGDAGMRQRIDKLDGMQEKRFYLQYTFPPSSVGETGRVGSPGRREIGHGNLAERALATALPTQDDFPYAIRVESLITESHGSSSMASVCGGCLALLDAGVPLSRSVAGIAMGMLLSDSGAVPTDEDCVILSDITGTEDALGTMDFKVAGDEAGISAFQLDIKCEGLTVRTMERALEQARAGRLHILSEMKRQALSEPRSELKPTVPKIAKFAIPPETIGKVIGPGGKQIRAIIEDFDLSNMDVTDEGHIEVSSLQRQRLEQAKEFVLKLIGSGDGGAGAGSSGGGGGGKSDRVPYAGPEPVVGDTYTGKITGVHAFGVFVEIVPAPEDGSYGALEGLVHVSELARERVRNCEAFMRSMNVDQLTVKYLGKNEKTGKVQLSRKAVLQEQYGGGGGAGSRGGKGNKKKENVKTRNSSSSSSSSRKSSKTTPSKQSSNGSTATTNTTAAVMSEEEIDVIAKAIEGVQDLS